MVAKRKTKKVKSALPIYISGIVWIGGLVLMYLFGINRLSMIPILILIALCVASYVIASRLIPEEEVEIETIFTIDEKQADEFYQEGNKFIVQLKDLDEQIEDEIVSVQIRRVYTSTAELLDFVVENPQQASRLRKFMTYYLPTLTSLLQSYDDLETRSVKGENMNTAMSEIEGTMHTVADAFEKQLDLLYLDKKVDIVSDIQVLETLMSQQGLTKEQLNGRE